jgi:tetratricopeptide (TPR) repeat protein
MFVSMRPASGLLLAASLLWSAALSAQSLPRPAEFYFEADAGTTRSIVAVKGADPVGRLLKAVERDPGARAEAAQLARLAMDGGQVEIGETFYRRALTGLPANSALWRPVMWNYGWDLYRAGRHADALQCWTSLVTVRSTSAAWVPPTLALALWTAGRKDEAVQWYAAAVRTEPQLWSQPANLPRLLPDWREPERATLAEVLAAWAALPPR